MKKLIFTIALFIALLHYGVGQVPQIFSYQAVLRNTDGTIMANQPVDVKISLRKISVTGDIVYTETENTTTSPQGIISLSIGDGNVVNFAAIPWNLNIYIQIEVKKTSETVFQMIGVSQILSVPYAINAGNVKEVKSQSSANDAIFEVKNSNGDVVFGVYQGGVRMNVSDNSSAAKGSKGGFAVGGLTSKGITSGNMLFVDSDSTRINFKESTSKGSKGGFAVGGLTSKGKSGGTEYFKVTNDTSYFTNTIYTTQDIVTTGTINTGVGVDAEPVTDVEGNIYQTVVIGTQTWMKENLKTTKYSDGTPIHADSVFIYENSIDPLVLQTYGRLYTGIALNLQSRNVCPTGWHVPSTADWDSLFNYVGGPYYLQTPIVTGLKLIEPGTISDGKGFWNNDNNANNSSGFSARPGGYGFQNTAMIFNGIGDFGNWWGLDYILGGYVNAMLVKIDGTDGRAEALSSSISDAYSVRCVKGNPVIIISK